MCQSTFCFVLFLRLNLFTSNSNIICELSLFFLFCQEAVLEDEPDSKTEPIKAPVFTLKPEPLTIKEGETIKLTCAVTGKKNTKFVHHI